MKEYWIIATVVAILDAAEVNILWVTDPEKNPGNEAISAFLDSPPTGISVKYEKLDSDIGDIQNGIMELCGTLDGMIDAGNPPDLIVDSVASGFYPDVIRTTSYTLGLPTLSLNYHNSDTKWSQLNTKMEQYLVHIRPPGDVITGIIREVVSRQNITNAAILFDDTFVMDYKYRDLLLNVPTRHVIHSLEENDAGLRSQLRRIADIDINNFFILGSVQSVSKVLSIGQSIQLSGAKYAWYGLTQDTDTDVSCNGCNGDKMIMIPKSGNNRVSTLKRSKGIEGGPDIDVAFYYDTVHIAVSAVSTMKDAGNWPSIEYKKCNEYTDTEPIERDIGLLSTMKTLAATTQVHFAPIHFATIGHMNLDVELHKLKFNSGRLSSKETIGSWNTDDTTNFKLNPGKSLGSMAANTVYRIVTVIQPPFMIKNTDSDGNVVYSGYCMDLLEALSELMNFQYEIYEAPDGQYGRMTPNKTWNGMINELYENRADIGLGALGVMAERETVIDFTVPYYDLVGITIMMKRQKVETSLFRFLTVLEDSVWACILAAYFFTSFLMWIFDKFSPYSYQNNLEKFKEDEEKRFFNFKECLWFCMTSLTPQGGGEAPKNLSGRLVAATWWLFGFIIIASYTANLAAFLTVSRLETPVESLEDLSKQYKIQYSPQKGSDASVYFERMAYIEEKFYQIWKDMSLNDNTDEYERSKLAVWDYPVSDKYTKMWQSMQEAVLPESLEEAKERVRQSKSSSEGYAFIGDATDIRYQVLTNCDLQMVGEEFSRKPYALAVQQRSPLKDTLNDAILRLLNQRKLETFKERWWNQNPEKKECEDYDEDTGGGISIYNIGGVFIVIFVGIALAVITLIVEYWYYKYKKPASRISTGSEDKVAKQLKIKNAKNNETYYGENRGANVPTVDRNW